jgi:hypothetical protein
MVISRNGANHTTIAPRPHSNPHTLLHLTQSSRITNQSSSAPHHLHNPHQHHLRPSWCVLGLQWCMGSFVSSSANGRSIRDFDVSTTRPNWTSASSHLTLFSLRSLPTRALGCSSRSWSVIAKSTPPIHDPTRVPGRLSRARSRLLLPAFSPFLQPLPSRQSPQL